jgi:hypothetical protein
MGFYFMKTMYTQFYVDEAHLLSFFINYLSYHKKAYVVAHLLKMKLSLKIA